jgi:hypothetical protein
MASRGHLFDAERAANPPEIDPADAVIAVHRFLVRCRAWGAEREVPRLLARLGASPTPAPEDAAKLHAWTSWVAFVDHALGELESGKLDPWFIRGDGV